MPETQNSTLTITVISDLEIELTREFDAPRELVFEAMTKPEHVARWWGPRYLTTTVAALDLRPGGAWRFVQRDPEGNEFAFNGVFREIVPPERVSQTFEFEGMPGHVTIDMMTLEDLGGRTKVTARSLFQSREDRDAMLQSGMEAGAAESYDRLAELLQTLA